MPTPYSGVAGATQSPSPQPAERRVPIINLPIGGERGAAIWTQPFKVIADWAAFIAASLPTAPVGALLRVSVLTAGTSLAKAVGCTRARVRMVGGGGGGGGAGVGSGLERGGGGAAGGYCEWFTAVIPATWTYAIGAAGTAGTGAPTNGGNGGSTTFFNGATTVTAFGGGGGQVGPVNTASLQGVAAAMSTNGTINGRSDPGDAPQALSLLGGQGGSSLLGGAGGRVLLISSAFNNGNPGIGYGAGGSGGSAPQSSGSATGGAGTAGAIVLEEYS